MNELLRQVVEEIQKLPEDEQNAIARHFLSELREKKVREDYKIVANYGEKSFSNSPRYRWDISVYNRENQRILIVEVKRSSNASLDWAMQLRHQIFANDNFPIAPYVMLVFTDKIYLWCDRHPQDLTLEPSYIIDATPIFQPYFERSKVTAEHISEYSFAMIVASWLREIIRVANFPEDRDRLQEWLVESRLLSAIEGGDVRYEDWA